MAKIDKHQLTQNIPLAKQAGGCWMRCKFLVTRYSKLTVMELYNS